MTFRLTQRQELQVQMVASDATHIMAYGGSCSVSWFPAPTRVTIAPL
jgi:hypothetical protein